MSTAVAAALWFAFTLIALFALGVVVVDWFRQRRIRRITSELNRAEAELRAAMLLVANELGADAHEARKALIRVSFLASGQAKDEF